MGINDKGEMFGVIGSGQKSSKKNRFSQQPDRETEHLALWENGRTHDLGTLLGQDEDWCVPTAMNNRGEIIGTFGPFAARPGDINPNAIHIFLWSNGRLHDLGSNGEAVGINSEGQVVGEKTWPDGQHGFLYSRGAMQEVRNPLGSEYSEVKAINGKAQMVGVASGPSKRTGPQPNAIIHTFLWNNGAASGIRLPQHDGFSTYGGANAINDAGQAVINADDLDEAGAKSGLGATSRCYLWQNGTVTDLGTLPGFSMNAVAINNRGQIIGNATKTGGYPQSNFTHPFLWQSGVLHDLNDLTDHKGAMLTHVLGLNNRGQIVGYGEGSGKHYSFLLTPVTK